MGACLGNVDSSGVGIKSHSLAITITVRGILRQGKEVIAVAATRRKLVQLRQYASGDEVNMNQEAGFWRKDGYEVTIDDSRVRSDGVYILKAFDVEEIEFPIYIGWDGQEHGEF